MFADDSTPIRWTRIACRIVVYGEAGPGIVAP